MDSEEDSRCEHCGIVGHPSTMVGPPTKQTADLWSRVLGPPFSDRVDDKDYPLICRKHFDRGQQTETTRVILAHEIPFRRPFPDPKNVQMKGNANAVETAKARMTLQDILLSQMNDSLEDVGEGSSASFMSTELSENFLNDRIWRQGDDSTPSKLSNGSGHNSASFYRLGDSPRGERRVTCIHCKAKLEKIDAVKFTKDDFKRERWLRALDNEIDSDLFYNLKCPFICKKHFPPECFSEKGRLYVDAVPVKGVTFEHDHKLAETSAEGYSRTVCVFCNSTVYDTDTVSCPEMYQEKWWALGPRFMQRAMRKTTPKVCRSHFHKRDLYEEGLIGCAMPKVSEMNKFGYDSVMGGRKKVVEAYEESDAPEYSSVSLMTFYSEDGDVKCASVEDVAEDVEEGFEEVVIEQFGQDALRRVRKRPLIEVKEEEEGEPNCEKNPVTGEDWMSQMLMAAPVPLQISSQGELLCAPKVEEGLEGPPPTVDVDIKEEPVDEDFPGGSSTISNLLTSIADTAFARDSTPPTATVPDRSNQNQNATGRVIKVPAKSTENNPGRAGRMKPSEVFDYNSLKPVRPMQFMRDETRIEVIRQANWIERKLTPYILEINGLEFSQARIFCPTTTGYLCIIGRCSESSKNRLEAIQHFISNHTNCKKPIFREQKLEHVPLTRAPLPEGVAIQSLSSVPTKTSFRCSKCHERFYEKEELRIHMTSAVCPKNITSTDSPQASQSPVRQSNMEYTTSSLKRTLAMTEVFAEQQMQSSDVPLLDKEPKQEGEKEPKKEVLDDGDDVVAESQNPNPNTSPAKKMKMAQYGTSFFCRVCKSQQLCSKGYDLSREELHRKMIIWGCQEKGIISAMEANALKLRVDLRLCQKHGHEAFSTLREIGVEHKDAYSNKDLLIISRKTGVQLKMIDERILKALFVFYGIPHDPPVIEERYDTCSVCQMRRPASTMQFLAPKQLIRKLVVYVILKTNGVTDKIHRDKLLTSGRLFVCKEHIEQAFASLPSCGIPNKRSYTPVELKEIAMRIQVPIEQISLKQLETLFKMYSIPMEDDGEKEDFSAAEKAMFDVKVEECEEEEKKSPIKPNTTFWCVICKSDRDKKIMTILPKHPTHRLMAINFCPELEGAPEDTIHYLVNRTFATLCRSHIESSVSALNSLGIVDKDAYTLEECKLIADKTGIDIRRIQHGMLSAFFKNQEEQTRKLTAPPMFKCDICKEKKSKELTQHFSQSELQRKLLFFACRELGLLTEKDVETLSTRVTVRVCKVHPPIAFAALKSYGIAHKMDYKPAELLMIAEMIGILPLKISTTGLRAVFDHYHIAQDDE